MVEQNKVSSREIARVGRFALTETILEIPEEALEEVSTREICRVGRFALMETVYKARALSGDLPLRKTSLPKARR